MITRGPGSGVRGFTLLELVIALSIVATLVVILLGGFRIGLSAWNRGEESAEAHQHLRSLAELFQRTLTSAYPYKMRPKEGGEPQILFKGSAESVSFVSSAPPFPSDTPIAFTAVSVAFEPAGEGGLAIRQKPLPNDNPFETESPILLDREIVGASFKFQKPSGEWEESWDGATEKKIPSAVEVKLQRRSRAGVEELPAFTITLRASTP